MYNILNENLKLFNINFSRLKIYSRYTFHTKKKNFKLAKNVKNIFEFSYVFIKQRVKINLNQNFNVASLNIESGLDLKIESNINHF